MGLYTNWHVTSDFPVKENNILMVWLQEDHFFSEMGQGRLCSFMMGLKQLKLHQEMIDHHWEGQIWWEDLCTFFEWLNVFECDIQQEIHHEANPWNKLVSSSKTPSIHRIGLLGICVRNTHHFTKQDLDLFVYHLVMTNIAMEHEP